MTTHHSRYRWFVVGVFFIFMLLHQVDQLLIGPLTSRIMDEFHITMSQMGLVNTLSLIVATVFYPLWGYLYDRFARSKLLALASFIWGATTWLSSVVHTYPLFAATRASTGVDNSAYPGLFSLIADYFPPGLRGRVYGILSLTGPIGYLLGMILALMLAPALGWDWRTVFIFTGGLGILLSIVIFFGIREVPRGRAEPEFDNVVDIEQFNFNWESVKDVFKKRTTWFVMAQGFFGVIPWNVITFWFFTYLERERNYSPDSILFTMAPAILLMSAGYFVGGALGDWLFKRIPQGRLLIAITGVIFGVIFLYFAMQTPIDQANAFFAFLCIGAFFMPFPSANILATLIDVTLPEVRSTAQSVESFIENSGAAVAPFLAGWLAEVTSLGMSILVICVSAWAVCIIFFIGIFLVIKKDLATTHYELSARVKPG